MGEKSPELISVKEMKQEFAKHSRIKISNREFTIGRAMNNSEVILFPGISRIHCTLRQKDDNTWTLQDHSTFGTTINGHKIEKNMETPITNQDVIELEQTLEFVYKFHNVKAVKRKLSEVGVEDRIQDARDRLQSTQTLQLDNMESKIKHARIDHMDTVNQMNLLQSTLQEKIVELERKYQAKIQELEGKDDENIKQKSILLEQNEAEKLSLIQSMNKQLQDLEEKVENQKRQDKQLETENNALLERLSKEQEEINRLLDVTHLKDQQLELLEKQLADKENQMQEERRERERLQSLDLLAQKEAQEMEVRLLQEKMKKQQSLIDEKNALAEREFQQRLEKIQQDAEAQKKQVEQQLAQSMADICEMETNRLEAEETLKRENKLLQDALLAKQSESEESAKKLQKELRDKKTSLVVAGQPSVPRKRRASEPLDEIIVIDDATPKKVKPTLASTSAVIEILDEWSPAGVEEQAGAGTSGLSDLLEAECQCSICTEYFIEPTILNCSHTFCRHCIAQWKRNKRECPVCREPITSESHNLAVNGLIEKLVERLDKDAKDRRLISLKERKEEEEREGARPIARQVTRIPLHAALNIPVTMLMTTRMRTRTRNSAGRQETSITTPLVVDMTTMPGRRGRRGRGRRGNTGTS